MKNCFNVSLPIQVTSLHLTLNERISKQMVKFISHISKESIMEVQAEVVKAAEKIESCTQQNIELHVHQVWVVSATDPQLLLHIEDAAWSISDEDEGTFARVNTDDMEMETELMGTDLKFIRTNC